MEIEANKKPVWCIEKYSKTIGDWIRADLHTAVVKNGKVVVHVRPPSTTATYDVLLDVMRTAAKQWEFVDLNAYRIRNITTNDYIMGYLLR